MYEQLRGTGVAMVTPFQNDGSINFEALGRLIEHLIEGRVEYLVALGSTGEAITLTGEEQQSILDYCREKIAGRVPLIAGFGGSDTKGIIRAIESADLTGVMAILSSSPAYNKPSQEGIYQHYRAICDNTDLPVILYNVPGRTASNITARTTLRLANEIPNVVAIKEASGDLEQCMSIVREKPDDFLVISGEDALTLPMISFGMDGVISVVANALPTPFSDLVRFALAGNFKDATKIQMEILPFIQMLFAEGNPAGIKAALKILEICPLNLRLPLVPVSQRLYDQMREFLNKYPHD